MEKRIAMDNIDKITLEIDQISKEQWSIMLKDFDDATVFQTWEYGDITWGEQNLSHAVLRMNGRTLAAAQVRTVKLLPGLEYAYIAYGPMWRTSDLPEDCEVLDVMVSKLSEEYVKKRCCSLRIFPFIHDGDPNVIKIRNSFIQNGFLNNRESPRTIFLDISVPIEDLRKNLRKKWRQYLNHAEEAGLKVTFSKSPELFVDCLNVYREMHERKHFIENVKMDDFLALHEILPEAYKFKILTVGRDGRTDACVIFSAIGDTGLPVLAATATSALENKASYLANWEMIKVLRNEGIRWFDFRGIDPKGNPGGYQFKTGMSGKKGLEVSYLGDFILHRGKFNRFLLALAEKIKSRYQLTQTTLRRFLYSRDKLC
jgi:lipid II:glycine glycyltransferase (peptidoglycan interpeptide bridge formation enzyme)